MRIRQIVLLFVVVLLVLQIAPASAQGTCGPNVNYLVRPGDTLGQIARRFGTTISAIASANNIANVNRIFHGVTLRIPCADGGAPTLPTGSPGYLVPPAFVVTPFTPPAGDSNGVLPPVYVNPSFFIPPIFVDCTQLRGTAPLDGLAFGDNTFYWNPVPGATSYRVNVYSVDATPGRLVASFDVPATRTNLVGNVGGNAGPGFLFEWEVQALVSDIVICQSQRYRMFREFQD